MEADLEYIRQLYLQKLTGTLSEKEDKELEAAMQDPRIRKMCKELDELYRSPEMLELLRVRPTSKRWNELAEKVMEKTGEPMRYMRAFRWLAAACVAALVGFAGYLFMMPSRQQGGEMAAVKNTETPKIKMYDILLRLSNGERMALQPDKSMLVGDVQLETEGNALRFQQRSGGVGQWSTLEVPAKKDYKVVLSDGTEVWLNSASTLRFPFAFNGNVREVEIQGEAYFNVARNAEKPFIVRTPGGEIRVLGTAFNVNTYEPGRITASLVRGSIKAVGAASEKILQPGQAAAWGKDTDMKVARFEQAEVLAWMQGEYYYNGASLAELSKAIHRMYDLEVLIDNPSLTKLRFAGKLDKNKPIEDFLEVLRITKDVKHRLEGNTLHLF
ncbi:DUF4974 domain-containing protein [Chitinophaga lutea]|uniref:DUF4974 domain-containing protein n=1 Tax=Chitinophaga lutea TaxID=2488634 RepID=A0A3N4PVI0_9BACT|nr:FecR domain-containing protein [Chitinophaga lutea]RPE12622.1 DUF4974 domain-containing protein [Chitinophaga lutea]